MCHIKLIIDFTFAGEKLKHKDGLLAWIHFVVSTVSGACFMHTIIVKSINSIDPICGNILIINYTI